MPAHPIVDAHLHVWDPRRLRYPWLEGKDLLNRPWLMADYDAATAGTDVEAMVFVQCETDPAQAADEAAWVAGLAAGDPRIRGMVAWAPLERGRAAEADVAALTRHPILRGVRRIIQFEPDLDFCLRPDFVEGVRMLADFGLSFDICVDHRHMANVLRLAAAVPDVPLMLDHIGKPAIRDGLHAPWAGHLRELARMPHVTCKLSGVMTEAAPGLADGDLDRWVDTAIEAFGFDRLCFGGDWPVVLGAAPLSRWIAWVDRRLAGVPEADRRKVWRDNAVRFYRL
jgi:L-fuconolactonase